MNKKNTVILSVAVLGILGIIFSNSILGTVLIGIVTMLSLFFLNSFKELLQ
jgi:hypothetical protein